MRRGCKSILNLYRNYVFIPYRYDDPSAQSVASHRQKKRKPEAPTNDIHLPGVP
jgi:hypothetical protein